MRALFNLIYLLLLVIASPYLIWSAIFQGKYREGFRAKFLGQVESRQSSGFCIWLHAVSVGEVNLLQTLIQQLQSEYPQTTFYITTTTKTGFELAKKKYAEHQVDYCPLDFSWAVQNAYRRIRPDLLLLAELELWPNLISEAHRQQIPVAVVNGRLSENSFRGYQKIRFLIQPILKKINLLLVQNPSYANRFQTLGATNIQVTGNMKFDGAETSRKNKKTQELSSLAQLDDNHIVFLAGSTQPGEEQIALETFLQLKGQYKNLRLIIVPRHPERFDEVANLLQQANVPWIRRSQLNQMGLGKVTAIPRIILVDTIGELGTWWGTAQIAFVGGSLGSRGGQNMIEPAAYGAAVCFGPNTRNFRDVVQLMLEEESAVVVQNQTELTQFVANCLQSTTYRKNLGNKAAEIVRTQLGATERTIRCLQTILPSSLVKSEAA